MQPVTITNLDRLLTALIQAKQRGDLEQTVLDLEKIVIGGGISVQSRVIDEIRARVATYLQVTPLAARTIKLPEIVAAKYRNDANLVGAVVPLVAR